MSTGGGRNAPAVSRMTGVEWFLVGWSFLTLVWWLIALVLLVCGPRQHSTPGVASTATLTVFKPLPPVTDESKRVALAGGIDSFLAQLRPEDEIILGVNSRAAAEWQPHLNRWQETWPTARIVIVTREVPTQHANPKIAWLETLAASAQGELWLWTDADVSAPAGFLPAIRAQFSDPSIHAVTAAYAVRRVPAAAGMLDALFVNLEFLPGALLLDRLGRRDFAYGAATAFRAATFRTRVNWTELGASLADDHELGRRLQPVVLAPLLVSTFTQSARWRAAWQHYYRWQKTVRWCRPGGFAALLILLPALGWGLAAASSGRSFFLTGLLSQWALEVTVGALACVFVGCRPSRRAWLGLFVWPLARALVWLMVWLPLPAVWTGRERAWFGPRQA